MSDTALLSPIAKTARLARRARWRRLIWSVALAVVALHVAAVLIAGLFVIFRHFSKPEPIFQRQKDLNLPATERQQRMDMASFDALAPKPSFNDKLQALKPAPILLPDLPKVPVDQMLPLDPSAIVSEQVSAMVGAPGTGSGTGSGGSGQGGTGSGVSFFGIQDTAKNVVIIVDTSDTMFVRSLEGKKHRFKFAEIKDETAKLINGLNPSSRFNVVIYEGGAMAFAGDSFAATDQNKAAAEKWIRSVSENPKASINTRPSQGPKLMEGGGTRLDTGFRQAFQMKPDVVYLITDGQVTSPTGAIEPRVIDRELRETLHDLQDKLETPARIHVVYYVTVVARAEEARRLRAIAGNNRGQFIQITASEKEPVTP
jgi:hypothetical protein